MAGEIPTGGRCQTEGCPDRLSFGQVPNPERLPGYLPRDGYPPVSHSVYRCDPLSVTECDPCKFRNKLWSGSPDCSPCAWSCSASSAGLETDGPACRGRLGKIDPDAMQSRLPWSVPIGPTGCLCSRALRMNVRHSRRDMSWPAAG